MASYETCIAAIKEMERKGGGTNVKEDSSLVQCGHTPTECKWIGNGSLYTCLKKPCDAPQRVYHKTNGGNGGKLT